MNEMSVIFAIFVCEYLANMDKKHLIDFRVKQNKIPKVNNTIKRNWVSDLRFSQKFNFLRKSDDRGPLKNALHEWALKNRITHNALNELLTVLDEHAHIKMLPRNSRTLLRTPRIVEIQKMGNGEFWYGGIKECLQTAFKYIQQKPAEIKLNISVDGMTTFKSSKKKFWPIQINIVKMQNIPPMIVGLWGGFEPFGAEQFLRQFVNELNVILSNGIILNSSNIRTAVKINSFICDTPARAFIKCELHSIDLSVCLQIFVSFQKV